MSHLDPLCSSLGFRIGGLQDPPSPSSLTLELPTCCWGGDVQGSWGVQAKRGRAMPGGLCPLASLGRGCSPAPERTAPPGLPRAPHLAVGQLVLMLASVSPSLYFLGRAWISQFICGKSVEAGPAWWTCWAALKGFERWTSIGRWLVKVVPTQQGVTHHTRIHHS